MSTNHENKIEKVICKCTDKTCVLSYCINPDIECITFIPTINNEPILEYKDQNKTIHQVPKIYSKPKALYQAYQIAKQCPNFNKTR